MERDHLSHETAVQHFVDAVIAFSDDPGPANLERYLTASRSLDEAKGPSGNDRRPGARTAASGRVAPSSGYPG